MSVTVRPNFDVCPLALAECDRVVKFADVDGSAFVFATTQQTGKTTRAVLDEIFSETDLEFYTARLASTVDLDTVDVDFDMLFIYE